MKRAVVLSGGGAKGAYQLGVWKALRRLNINYDIVTGTSVGALNGVMMVQNDYFKALKLWYYMDYKNVIDIEIKKQFNSNKGKQEIIGMYAKGAFTGGYEMSGLKKVINNFFDSENFFSSKVDFGLVTTKFPSLKAKYILKNKVDKDLFKDYLLASASCFPAFKMTKIKNEYYLDGGYNDNLPIDLAIKLGAEEIIAVDLRAVGVKKDYDKNKVKVTTITPKNDIGNFLVFEKDYTRRSINLGYNDTMKKFNKLEGNLYAFKINSLHRNYIRKQEKFMQLFSTFVGKDNENSKLKKFMKNNFEKEFNEVLEQTAKLFDIDPSKIYRTSTLNMIIKRNFSKIKLDSFKGVKELLKNKILKNTFISKELVLFIYQELNKNKKSNKILDNIIKLFSDSFLCALYLKTLVG